jgi:sialic acid synthase SpsE
MKIVLLLTIITLASCSPSIYYIGSSLKNPTEEVEIFFTESSIEKPYKIIGKAGLEHNFAFYSQQEIANRFIKKAKKVGADAILYLEVRKINYGTTINNNSKTKIDTLFNTKTVNNTVEVIHNPETIVPEVYFIKYK